GRRRRRGRRGRCRGPARPAGGRPGRRLARAGGSRALLTALRFRLVPEVGHGRLVLDAGLVEGLLHASDQTGHALERRLRLELPVASLEVAIPQAVLTRELAVEAQREHEEARLPLDVVLLRIALREDVARESRRERAGRVRVERIEQLLAERADLPLAARKPTEEAQQPPAEVP